MVNKTVFILLVIIALSGCLGVPSGIEPVDNFQLDRYLGRWYEIARLDHSFERGMDNVTAEYVMRDDGGIKVVNSGRSIATGEIKRAEGRAYFVESPNSGHLKVSFFGPFFGSYVIFELDTQNYQYAFIAGNSHDYLWLLARSPEVSQELIDHFKSSVSKLGFNADNLIFN